MKMPRKELTLAVIVLATGFGQASLAQTQLHSIQQVVSSAQALAALEPVAEKTIPVVSLDPASPPGTYWFLQQSNCPPLPFDPFPELPCYGIGDDNYIVDDRSVDYEAMWQATKEQAVAQAGAGGAAEVASLISQQETEPLGPQPKGREPQLGDMIEFAWLELTGPFGTNAPQLTVYTADYGGGWFWGIARGTNLGDYDPREYSWELMNPSVFTYDLDGGIYTFEMPPFDKPMEFYKTFDTDDYFAGFWTPIKYLGCNIPDGEPVTTNDVVMTFDLKGDIYKLLKDPNQAVEAVIVRPSGEIMGCYFSVATNGIATVIAPASSFASGLNVVWVGFVNEGPQYVDYVPEQPPDEAILNGLDIPGQRAYLQSLGVDPATLNTTNNHPHEFMGYLLFDAAPPIEDTVGSPYLTPYWSGSAFSRTYKCGGQNAAFTVRLLTESNQLLAETNGVTQLDVNSEYTFAANLDVPEAVFTNLDTVVADVQAQVLDGNGNPDTNQPPSRIIVPYIIDQTKFRGMYNTVAWCSMTYGDPSPGLKPWKIFWYLIDKYLDAFLEYSANVVLTAIGMQFQVGASPAIPDPYVLDLKPAYQFTGTDAQLAHFADVLTNSLYMGINFLSHLSGNTLFDDRLNLWELADAAGNKPGYFNPGERPLIYHFRYKRRMDVWMEGSCDAGWRMAAGFFGTPREIDQERTPIKPTVAFGYDKKFRPVFCCAHFESLGQAFYPLFADPMARAREALQTANALHPEALYAQPALQGHPLKTCIPNR